MSWKFIMVYFRRRFKRPELVPGRNVSGALLLSEFLWECSALSLRGSVSFPLAKKYSTAAGRILSAEHPLADPFRPASGNRTLCIGNPDVYNDHRNPLRPQHFKLAKLALMPFWSGSLLKL